MLVVIRGGGDLASGVALRLFRAGMQVAITELPQPLAIRRTVSFSEAIYAGEVSVEGITARRVEDFTNIYTIHALLAGGCVPVVIDPQAQVLPLLQPAVVVDGRMLKLPQPPLAVDDCFWIGLGPGFIAGKDCHAVIETQRGHTLGRVIRQGSANVDSGNPEGVAGYTTERVLRAPASGTLTTRVEIGALLQEGQPVAEVSGQMILSPFAGVLRGLLHPDLEVEQGVKIGDVDPRNDPLLCKLVSDKALAIGGGVLEAILSQPHLRPLIYVDPS